MAAKKKTAKKKATKKVTVENYRHDSATRKNIPTAKIAAEGIVPRVGKVKYAYSAHMSPELRFDSSGQSDGVSAIVEKAAAGNKLTKEEAEILRGVAANVGQPWLEWSRKKEDHDRAVLEVEPVALHIHERVSTNAIIRAAKREDVQADLFADPRQGYKEAIQFYEHDVDWANRLILGDSLEVMSSLSKRESLAGQVQMVFMDPPYGIKFGSNFQPLIEQKVVKDGDSDLIREPEMVKAFRDTWSLGTHTYLTYLRDRLMVAKDLLSESGSIFFQIGDENLHRARLIFDEVFGAENFIAVIAFKKKKMPLGEKFLFTMCDYLLWYAKDREKVKYRSLYLPRDASSDGNFTKVETRSGELVSLDRVTDEVDQRRQFRTLDMRSTGRTESCVFKWEFEGKEFNPSAGKSWKTNKSGMARLQAANRLYAPANSLNYRLAIEDYPVQELSHMWMDTQGATGKVYVVQTAEKVVDRCMLMATDPGDLVLDPTCGSGTTAYVAEKWGRRWITVDTSRVSVSIARQRLLTANFSSFELRNAEHSQTTGRSVDPSRNFNYKTAPHVTVGSIAQNQNLDPIIEKFEKLLESKLTECNNALLSVDDSLREKLISKLAEDVGSNGIKSVTDSMKARCLLPGTTKDQIQSAFTGGKKLSKAQLDKIVSAVPAQAGFQHWNVPYIGDDDWPAALCESVVEYRAIWQQKMDEVDECVKQNSEQIELFDQPIETRGITRVSGPFSVEGVRPEEISLSEDGELFDPTPNEFEVNDGQGGYSQNASAYLDRMLQLIGQDGVTFPNNEHRKFKLVELLDDSDSALHAEALWEGADDGDVPNLAIAFGPQHGPVTASQVEDLIRASRRYDELVIAAFSFDGSSQAVIQESVNPRLKIHMAHIRPDVSPGMDGLLKDSPKSQLFTVFGQPEIKVHEDDDEFKVELIGVDVYSPLTGEITSSGANKVAAWFLDSTLR